MLTRRSFATATIAAVCAPRNLFAQNSADSIDIEGELPPLPDDLKTLANAPAYRWTGTAAEVGGQPPTGDEIRDAAAVLKDAPYRSHPYQVAQYFLDLGRNANDPRAKFMREWPERANPVIVEFFKATKTIPQGDITPWCAAFVNWCIARGNSKTGEITDVERKLTTQSALSGSFRCWGETRDPQAGDVVVFAQSGTEDLRCGGKGHVAFYLDRLPDGRIRILGGNQALAGTSGAVTISRYPIQGGESGRLRFFAFRTSGSLRV